MLAVALSAAAAAAVAGCGSSDNPAVPPAANAGESPASTLPKADGRVFEVRHSDRVATIKVRDPYGDPSVPAAVITKACGPSGFSAAAPMAISRGTTVQLILTCNSAGVRTGDYWTDENGREVAKP